MELVVEVGAHFLFGAAAGLPTRRLWLMALCGVLAVGIDVDHGLAYVGLSEVGRASHSFLFIPVAALGGTGAVRLAGAHSVSPAEAGLLAVAAIFSHLAYDSLTGGGIPLFAPLSQARFSPDVAGMLLFELAAIVVAALSRLARRSVSLRFVDSGLAAANCSQRRRRFVCAACLPGRNARS